VQRLDPLRPDGLERPERLFFDENAGLGAIVNPIATDAWVRAAADIQARTDIAAKVASHEFEPTLGDPQGSVIGGLRACTMVRSLNLIVCYSDIS